MIRKKKSQDSALSARRNTGFLQQHDNPFGGRRMVTCEETGDHITPVTMDLQRDAQMEEPTEMTPSHGPSKHFRSDETNKRASKALCRSALTRHHTNADARQDRQSHQRSSQTDQNAAKKSEINGAQPAFEQMEQACGTDKNGVHRRRRSNVPTDKYRETSRKKKYDIPKNRDDCGENLESATGSHFNIHDAFHNALSEVNKMESSANQFQKGGLSNKAYAALKYFLTLSSDNQGGCLGSTLQTEMPTAIEHNPGDSQQLMNGKLENDDVANTKQVITHAAKKKLPTSTASQSSQKYHVRREKVDSTGDGSEKAYVIHVECASEDVYSKKDRNDQKSMQSRKRRGDFARIRQINEEGQQRSSSLTRHAPSKNSCRASKSNDCLYKSSKGQQNERKDMFAHAVPSTGWAATKEGTPILRHYPKRRRSHESTGKQKGPGSTLRLIDHLERQEQLGSKSNDNKQSAYSNNVDMSILTGDKEPQHNEVNKSPRTKSPKKQQGRKIAESEAAIVGNDNRPVIDWRLNNMDNLNEKPKGAKECDPGHYILDGSSGDTKFMHQIEPVRAGPPKKAGVTKLEENSLHNWCTNVESTSPSPQGRRESRDRRLSIQNQGLCAEFCFNDAEQESGSEGSSLTVTFLNNKLMEDKACQYSPPKECITFEKCSNGQSKYDECVPSRNTGSTRVDPLLANPKNQETSKAAFYRDADDKYKLISEMSGADIPRHQHNSRAPLKSLLKASTSLRASAVGTNLQNRAVNEDNKHHGMENTDVKHYTGSMLPVSDLPCYETDLFSKITPEFRTANVFETEPSLAPSSSTQSVDLVDGRDNAAVVTSSESLTAKQTMLLSVAMQNENQSNPRSLDRNCDSTARSPLSFMSGIENFPSGIRDLMSLYQNEVMSIGTLQRILEDSKAKSHVNVNKLNVNTNADEPRTCINSVSSGTVTAGGEPVSIFIGEYLQKLWKNQCLCDVEVTVNNEIFLVHKLVLAAFSRVFCPTTPKPCPSIRFEVPNTTPAAVYQIFCYLYTSNMELSDNLLEPVLSAALFMEITEVVDIIQDIISKPSMENIEMYTKIMEKNGMVSSLLDHPEVYQAYFSELRDSDFFLELSVEEMEHLLMDPDVMVNDEIETIESIASWVKFNFLQRINQLPRLLKLVSFECISPQVLADLTEKYDYLFKTPCGNEFISEAFKFHALKMNSHFEPCIDGQPPKVNSRCNNECPPAQGCQTGPQGLQDSMWETEMDKVPDADGSYKCIPPRSQTSSMRNLSTPPQYDEGRRDRKASSLRDNRRCFASISDQQTRSQLAGSFGS